MKSSQLGDEEVRNVMDGKQIRERRTRKGKNKTRGAGVGGYIPNIGRYSSVASASTLISVSHMVEGASATEQNSLIVSLCCCLLVIKISQLVSLQGRDCFSNSLYIL